VYPEERLREPAIAAVREWVLGLRTALTAAAPGG